MDLGSFVRERRRALNLSQTELAERAGVGLNFVYQLEKNKPTVQLNCARAVLNALGCDLSVALPTAETVEAAPRSGASVIDRPRRPTSPSPWD